MICAVLLEALGGDDGVGEAGLVLDGDEDEPLGGPRPLADDHHAGHARAAPLRHRAEIGGARDPLTVERGAREGDRVRADRQVGAGVVGGQLFLGGHLGQRRRRSCVGVGRRRETAPPSVRAPRPARAPPGASPPSAASAPISARRASAPASAAPRDREVGQRRERRRAPRRLDAPAELLAKAAHRAQAEPHGAPARPPDRRATPSASRRSARTSTPWRTASLTSVDG